MNSAHKGDIKWFSTKQVDGLQEGGGWMNAQSQETVIREKVAVMSKETEFRIWDDLLSVNEITTSNA